MKFMGIDYGVKRIGIAVSDDDGRIAFPKANILNDSSAFKKIEDLIKSNNIGEIVVGESLNLKGYPNPIQARVEIFIRELKKISGLSVYKQKEFLTTIEARRDLDLKSKTNIARKTKKNISAKTPTADAKAASLILQRYLDKSNKVKT